MDGPQKLPIKFMTAIMISLIKLPSKKFLKLVTALMDGPIKLSFEVSERIHGRPRKVSFKKLLETVVKKFLNFATAFIDGSIRFPST